MRISVFGLGYVGTVSAACLAEMGHEVWGVDVDPHKVECITRGESPIVEELIGELVRDMAASGRLHATTDVAAAVAATDLSLVCVGTPSTLGGGLDATYVLRVAGQIGEALRQRSTPHTVVVRSTVLPGTVEGQVRPTLEEAAGRAIDEQLGLCFHPEFLREGSSVRDFREPPKIVIGASGQRAAQAVASLYEGFTAPLFVTPISVAEMVKYADNAFHALKVVFGNEIGTICKALGIDSHAVMEIFCQDRRLNISPAYLMPGFAYGGSCLPKDLRALLHMARTHHIELPMLGSLAPSNDQHLLRALELVMAQGRREVGVLGLSFKPGTDDLRESPLVELVERLLGKGCHLRIHDANVSLARLRGRNKAYIEQKLPHLSELLVPTAADAVTPAEVVIVGARSAEYRQLLEEHAASKVVVDLVRLYPKGEPMPPFAAYHGLCW